MAEEINYPKEKVIGALFFCRKEACRVWRETKGRVEAERGPRSILDETAA